MKWAYLAGMAGWAARQKIGLAHDVAAMRGAQRIDDAWLAGQIGRAFIASHASLTDRPGSGQPLDARVLEVELSRAMQAAKIPAAVIQKMQEDFSTTE